MTFSAVGDICVNRDEPETAFALCRAPIREADIAFCQLETMYSDQGYPSLVAFNALRADPGNMAALTFAGIDVVSLATNHVLDWGDEALLDTIRRLEERGMHVIGAGKNLADARKPAVLERGGVRVAFLAYNSILPHRYWADTGKAGCNPMRVSILYEAIEHGQPGTPCRILTYPEKEDVDAMRGDIRNARLSADVMIVSMHWGLHFAPAVLAAYQPDVGHMAIDAGADLIIGHHPHILKGIEVYKGKVIFYSLGNFIFDRRAKPEDFETPRRLELRKLYPEWRYQPDYPTYPFPVDSRKTIIVRALISNRGIDKVSFVPSLINPNGQPEILPARDPRSADVFSYMNKMSHELGTRLSFDGDEVLVHTG